MQCSFCGKRRRQVGKLIAGANGVFICNECVELCNRIIDEEIGRGPKLPVLCRPIGHVVLDDFAAICLDSLGCRVLWPVIDRGRRLLQSSERLLAELVPELAGDEPTVRAIAVEVCDLEGARERLRGSGLFEAAEELRESAAGKAAVFGTRESGLAVLIAGTHPGQQESIA